MITDEAIYYGLAVCILLLISAFFSASETALTAVNRARIYQLVMDGNRRAQIVSRLRREKESLIGAVLLGNNAVNTAASTLATSFAISLTGGSEMGLVIVTLVMTVLVVVFAEVLPKTYAIQNSERTALFLSPMLSPMVKLLSPITHTIQFFIRMLLKIFGIDITKMDTLVSATDVVRGTIELHHREGKMIKQDRDMLGSILDLNDIEVKDIMVHRMQVETVDADLPPVELVKRAFSTMHSRLPLWRGQPDNIVGVLHVKNLIKTIGEHGDGLTNEHILQISTTPWFIPETSNLRDQLLAFRNKRQHLAFVVDEYGAWQGVVTLEDIMEEIVGNIDDEHDETASDVQKIGIDNYFVAGSMTIRDVNRQMEWNLPDDEASTVAGLLIHEAQTIPAIGEYVDMHGFRFTVVDKAASQITRLRIERLPGSRNKVDEEM
ncbi:MAG: CNNM domain-containing protein [Rickettsiales bacterium]|nr:CNNM domain-containing protein [Rickettsiales bacterium]